MNKLQEPENSGFETEQNLREFFYLLLKIDMRNHPELYRKPIPTTPNTIKHNQIKKSNK